MSLTVIKSTQFERIIHYQHTLDAVLVHQVTRFITVGILFDNDEPLARRHDVGDGLVKIALETQVAVGHDADDLFALQHWQAGYLVLTGQIEHVTHGHVRRDGDGIFHHAALETFDLGNLRRLLFGVMFLCTMPMPPSCASAIAKRASVTVSIAADSSGIFREMLRVSWVRRLTSRGNTLECAGSSSTSSKVRLFG